MALILIQSPPSGQLFVWEMGLMAVSINVVTELVECFEAKGTEGVTRAIHNSIVGVDEDGREVLELEQLEIQLGLPEGYFRKIFNR